MKSTAIKEPGQHTLNEILSQPQCWSACLSQLSASAELRAAAQLARPGAEWIFVGCGTSYYLAQAAASSFNYLRLPARAVAASELMLYPALTLHPGREYVPVVISRSGRTSEAVRAGQMLETDYNLRTIAITCADGQPLEQTCSVTSKLSDADEQSTVMTRSFTSMLLALQYLGAIVAGDVARHSRDDRLSFPAPRPHHVDVAEATPLARDDVLIFALLPAGFVPEEGSKHPRIATRDESPSGHKSAPQRAAEFSAAKSFRQNTRRPLRANS